jgi:hypothetical protein
LQLPHECVTTYSFLGNIMFVNNYASIQIVELLLTHNYK